ncbi:F-box protein [Roseateles sp. UC29_93]|uniref:F-box protein n=1 Tax=Roseateles sp. UC29_93 TaxID=3350177 RepID=UPI003672DAB6
MLPSPDFKRFELEASQPINDEPPPSGEAEARQDRGLNELPEEMLDQIAGHLPMRSLQALACVNQRMGSIVDWQFELKQRTLQQDIERFSWTSGLDDFRSLLFLVRRLPREDQTAMLQALCARLDRLPEAQRKPAAAAVLRDLSGLSERLVSQLRVLASHGSAASAVIAGEPLNAIAKCFEIDRTYDLERLALSHGPIQGAIDAGEDKKTVAKRYGVFPEDLPLPTRYWTFQGVQDPSLYIARLQQARRAVRQGEPVDAAVNRCFEGVDFLTTDRDDLVKCAVDGVAGEAAVRGQDVDAIAQKHGIDTERGRMELERLACDGAAGEKARAGENVAAVARHHGIRSAPYLLALLAEAMKGVPGDEVRTGEKTVEQVTHEHGLDLSQIAEAMEEHTADEWLSQRPKNYGRAMYELRRDISPAEFLEREANSGRASSVPRV